MFKKHMVPLSKGGQTVKHNGKGSQMTGMPSRSDIKGLSAPGSTMNDYAKASGADQPAGNPVGPMGGFAQGG